MDDELPTTTRSLRHRLAVDVLHVFVLSGFAVAQPVYDLLGKHAAYFVARGSMPVDVGVLVLTLSLALPAIVAGCLLVSRALGVVFYTAAFAAVQIALVAGIVLPATKTLLLPGIATLVPVGCGLLFALAYRKTRVVRLFLTVVSPAILIFPVVFVFATPVSKIVFPKEIPSASGAWSLSPESHVVFLVFDLLPVTALMDEHQNLDAERYPGFARMQAQSFWFRRARTVSRATAKAIPALLTGLYPRKDALGLLEDFPKNLFTLFGAAGDVHAFEPMTRLCPETLCGEGNSLSLRARLTSLSKDTAIVFLHLLLPERLTGRLPPIDSQWGSFDPEADKRTVPPAAAEGADELGERESKRESRREIRKKKRERKRKKEELHKLVKDLSSQDRLEKFEVFLEGLDRRAGRNLSFLHLDLPHGPFLYLSSGKKYVPEGAKYKRLHLGSALGKGGGKPGKRTWGPDRYLVDLAYQRLTHQIVLADKLVGQLLDRLDELGTLERSLVVITADHGQGYRPNGFQRSMADADTVHVPLFVKFPGQREGFVDDRAVESVDVLPTIVDALDLKLDWQFDGYSLSAGSGDESAVRRRQPLELERDLATCLRHKLDRVASDSLEIPGAGPRRELVGQRIADVLKTAREGEELTRLHGVKLDQEALLTDVDLSSDFVPAYLTGSLEPGGKSTIIDLAIALNGVIRATLTTYQTSGKSRFATMVAESSLVAGNNTWAVFRLQNEDRAGIQVDTLFTDDTNIVPAELPLFADGFESGDTSAWQ